MKKTLIIFYFSLLTFDFFGQSVTQKLEKAFKKFESDSQMKYGIASLYVIDAQTGQVVFDKNSMIGLAPASTQKIVTSVTAFELLGKDYRYQTEFWNTGLRLDINPSGDPTFGSWRWRETNADTVYSKLIFALKSKGVSKIKDVFLDNSGWDAENIPDGWIWQDIGNYYGAGAHKINFRENQYDISLKSGNNIGDSVKILSVSPSTFNYKQQRLRSKLTSAQKGSGDNAYVYLPDDTFKEYMIRGTIPVNEENFEIAASLTNPEWDFSSSLLLLLQEEMKFDVGHGVYDVVNVPFKKNENSNLIYTHYSPTLDSIIYWFNKKSINLYGEALVKTFAYEKKGFGSTDSGMVVLKDFWKKNGMDEDELGMVDGSGLSPLNRLTTHSQVEILRYAKSKDWFPYFYNSLPEFNAMKIKSGTIRGVKAFCGYHKSKQGKEYIFSFIVNNYNGLPAALVKKMYTVLDNLK